MGAHAITRATGTSGDTRQILDAIRRIVRALRESSRQSEAAIGLTGAQLFVLQSLASEDALSINDIAARTHTHQSSVSVVIQRLTDRGLLSRRRSDEDGRKHLVALTPRGRRLIARTADPAQVSLIAAIEGLPTKRRQALATLMHELVVAMALGDTPPEMFFESDRAEHE